MNRLMAVAVLTAGGLLLRQQMKKNATGGSGRMSTVTESIDVNVPLSTAYNQWTQFEDFPRFMAGVLEVRQLDDAHLLWRAEIGGQREEWTAEITHQIPDRLIAWRSVSGARNGGAVSFQRLGDDRTRVELRIDYAPRGAVEAIGDALGAVSARAKGNLRRFKSFLEDRGRETGAWRGTVASPQDQARVAPALGAPM